MTNREAHEAAYERRTSALATKHDPECDCGICQYCNGSEDKFGNPTDKGVREVGAIRRTIKMLVLIECSECDEAKTESIPLNGDLLSFRLEFSKSAWKYGWIVEADKVLCPNCLPMKKNGGQYDKKHSPITTKVRRDFRGQFISQELRHWRKFNRFAAE